jgi:hypothetical protein
VPQNASYYNQGALMRQHLDALKTDADLTIPLD